MRKNAETTRIARSPRLNKLPMKAVTARQRTCEVMKAGDQPTIENNLMLEYGT
jgi:hypothetical protein